MAEQGCRLRLPADVRAASYHRAVADLPEIPDGILAAQRTYDEAHAAVLAYSPQPGPPRGWSPEESAELGRLREAASSAATELWRLRAGTPWITQDGMAAVRRAARGEEG